MTPNEQAIDHGREAVKLLDRYDHVANHDNWPGGNREAYMARLLAAAQVHATLSVAQQLSMLPLP